MFTGIIEEVGSVAEATDSADIRTLRINAQRTLDGLQIGSSIAVNGVCLTVVEFDTRSFTVELVQETLRRSSLVDVTPGGLVNLERPMRADGRFDGHIVQGHVDGLGRIRSFGDDGILKVEFPPVASRYIVEKGSIAIDGISLTVAWVDESTFDVAIIPHTRKQTNLKAAKAGDAVNLEFDVVAKYVERMIIPSARVL